MFQASEVSPCGRLLMQLRTESITSNSTGRRHNHQQPAVWTRNKISALKARVKRQESLAKLGDWIHGIVCDGNSLEFSELVGICGEPARRVGLAVSRHSRLRRRETKRKVEGDWKYVLMIEVKQ